jgi:hypothetical protein
MEIRQRKDVVSGACVSREHRKLKQEKNRELKLCSTVLCGRYASSDPHFVTEDNDTARDSSTRKTPSLLQPRSRCPLRVFYPHWWRSFFFTLCVCMYVERCGEGKTGERESHVVRAVKKLLSSLL